MFQERLLNACPYELLTSPWRRVSLEKLIAVQLIKYYPPFMEHEGLFLLLKLPVTGWTTYWSKRIQFTLSHTTSKRSVLTPKVQIVWIMIPNAVKHHWIEYICLIIVEKQRVIYLYGRLRIPLFKLWTLASRFRLATGCMFRGSNPSEGDIFRTRPERPWGPTSLLYNGYRVFPGGKVTGAWPWPPTPIWSRGWRKSRTTHLLPLWVFVDCYRANFTFTFTFDSRFG